MEKAGYFSTTDVYKRQKIWQSSKELMNARATLASNMNAVLYGDTKSKSVQSDLRNKKEEVDNLIEKYRSDGYDAIVDPEDYLWNYQMPMIILNTNKIDKPTSKVVYDRSLKETIKIDGAGNENKAHKIEDEYWNGLWEFVDDQK